MPTTDAVAISKKAVNEFIESDAYRKCKNDDLIFAEFLSEDGSKLFLFEPNRFIQVDGIDEATAKVALYKASTKLPIKTKFVKRF